jgi:hypothetical protein
LQSSSFQQTIKLQRVWTLLSRPREDTYVANTAKAIELLEEIVGEGRGGEATRTKEEIAAIKTMREQTDAAFGNVFQLQD